MDVKESDILGSQINQHWYYKAKAAALTQLLSRHKNMHSILDVGAGSAFFSRYLLEHTTAQEAWCVDIAYETEYQENHYGKNIFFKREINSLNTDLVLLMDVLEHVDNDVELLKYYIEKVPQNAKFVISVPAFQFLWSNHDVFLEHRRRYDLPQLEQVVTHSGLKIIQSHYYFASVFPLATTVRLAERLLPKKSPQSQLKVHHPLVNTILTQLCLMEIPFQHRNRLAGLTVFCLAGKT